MTKNITMRDYFAGQALAGYMSGLKYEKDITPARQDAVAEGIYSMADAMIKARGTPIADNDLLKACRKASLALAHAATKDKTYHADYEAFVAAIAKAEGGAA